MHFKLNYNTSIFYDGNLKAVKHAVDILRRDILKKFNKTDGLKTEIILKQDNSMKNEEFFIDVTNRIIIYAYDELGFIYGLLYISEKFLDIKPFWFWMDQKFKKTDEINIEYGRYESVKPIIKYRGWFLNDEVLIMKWNIDGDTEKPWRMAFEALLRCGGNMVIPGTDKNSKKYRQLASDMGLWITHHHAEPLGAEMFARAYPNISPDYIKNSKLFIKLWEDGIKSQKDLKVIWTLGFRGQGDCPFWSHDSSNQFDTNHITMLPNSVDFVNKELSYVIEKNANDYWIINSSNIRPHTYYLDAIRKKWFGKDISDKIHSVEFSKDYYNGNLSIAQAYCDYHKAMLSYGSNEDEHAGEQFYTENIRIFVHAFFNNETDGTPAVRWLVRDLPLNEQIKSYCSFCRNNLSKIQAFYQQCIDISDSLEGDNKNLFDSTILLHASIHYYCTKGVVLFDDGYTAYINEDFKESFMCFGNSAEQFYKADSVMRDSEYGVWKGFYFNDCFADIKHTAYMIKKMMGFVRERGIMHVMINGIVKQYICQRTEECLRFWSMIII